MSNIVSNQIDILVVLFSEAINAISGMVPPNSPTIIGKLVYFIDITDTVNYGRIQISMLKIMMKKWMVFQS